MKFKLTDTQKKLVADNLGLVAWHIRKNVRNTDQPSIGRDYDDLFQDGCVGLAQAAASHPSDSDVPFASYALRRIQSAVHRSLQSSADTRSTSQDEHEITKRTHRSRSDPRFSGCEAGFDDSEDMSGGRKNPHETLGSRIRQRYHQAVRTVADDTRSAKRRRNDGHAMIERIVEERLLVPDDDSRTPLRQIARETGASYSRVLKTEKSLVGRLRMSLESDVEVSTLRAAARRSPDGIDTRLDHSVSRRIARVMGDRFRHAYDRASPAKRTEMLFDLLHRCDVDDGQFAESFFRRLSPDRQSAWLSALGQEHD